MPSTRNLLFAVVAWFGSLTSHATPDSQHESTSLKARTLDTAGIRKVYLDGDFEEAIERIESAQRKGGPFSHEDSVFIFKHLGVMYTAKYETREKGKANLVKLLHVEPGARIIDMYASDMIYMIFKNICDEYDLYQSKLKNSDKGTPGSEGKETGKTQVSEKKSRRFAWLGWTAGALAAAGGVALVVSLVTEGNPDQENIVP